MKRCIVRQVLMAKLAALALGALCLLQAPVRAQETSYNVIFPSVGLAPDQGVGFTFFNPNGSPVRAQLQIYNSGGMQVGLGDGSVRFLSYSIQAGAFYTFIINHSDIRLQGEAGTDRKQIYASASLTFSEAIKPVVASMEIISISDGTSNTILFCEVYPSAPSSGGGRDVLLGGDGRDVLMGIPPGKELRVTILKPRSSGPDYLPSRVKLFEANGSLIAQSPELVILPGESRSFKFNGDALHLQRDPGTSQARVRIKPFFNFESERLFPVLASFEIVDPGTGRTVMGGACAGILWAAFHNN
jgi:hypothetical protein